MRLRSPSHHKTLTMASSTPPAPKTATPPQPAPGDASDTCTEATQPVGRDENSAESPNQATANNPNDLDGVLVDDTNNPFRYVDINGRVKSPREINLSRIATLEKDFNSGYDSDGEIGPFYDCIEFEGDQDFDEDEIEDFHDVEENGDGNETGHTTSSTNNATVDDDDEEPPPPNIHIDIQQSTLSQLKGESLKIELRKRGIPVSGSKDVLLKRLKKALKDKVPVAFSGEAKKRSGGGGKTKSGGGNKSSGAAGGNKKKGGGVFPEDAYWKELTPNAEVVTEPENPTFTSTTTHAPTIEKSDAEFVPIKHNFDVSFDRPPFTGSIDVPKKYANGTVKKNRDGTIQLEKKTRKDGCLNPKFVKKYKLTRHTMPEEYMELFLPLSEENGVRKINGVEPLCFMKLTKWTNHKALLCGAGIGGCYPDYYHFTVQEIRQHVGLYIMHGLSPSPRVEYKFKPQYSDPLHGNDFVYKSFGPNAERRFRHFKAFFACQNPSINVPPRKEFPNWKVRPLLQWMNAIFPEVWLVGVSFSVDEMTMGFQGKHADAKRITYKRAGDGFQCDALCSDGFTYQFYMRNDPAPKKWMQEQGLSPLHARVMSLFDTLKDKYHECAMDNLYNSAKFCKVAANHPKRVLCHGVTRKGMRGIPKSVQQQEAKTREEQLAVRGTVKAAVLKNDPKCIDLVASSVYDTKPVHYLSMVAKEIKWVEVSKNVYNVDSGITEKMKFLRMNHIHQYNHTMGNVDIADQLRGSYDFKYWLRNRKWWWSLWNWGLGVMLTNAYIMYVKVNEGEGVDKKHIMSHHDFRKRIALHWINHEHYPTPSKPNNRKRKQPTINRRPGSINTRSTSSLNSPSSVSTMTRDDESAPRTRSRAAAEKNIRCASITFDSLLPSGNLNKRLNPGLKHFPIEPHKKNARCSLHRWAGVETQKAIMLCPTCNVHLCLACYDRFHTDHNLGHKRLALQKEYGKK